jgi:hypothetical protein
MAEIIQMCLINPDDWDKKFDLMSVKEMNRFIKQWMQISGDMSMIGEELGDQNND